MLPILERNARLAIRAKARRRGLRLTSAKALLEGGANGPAVVAGEPDSSLILKRISGDKPSMPPVGEPLTAEDVAAIRG
ncbi:MAG: c-type cytochrome domain-containing protein [Bryobacterales bacterium]